VVRERGGTPFRQIFWSRNGAPANIVGHRWNANTEAFRHITSYSLRWPSISLFSGPNCPRRGIWHQKSKKNISGGDTPGPPQREGATPSRSHPQHGYTTQAPPLLGPRCRKPFPQIKIYHYTPAYPDLILTAFKYCYFAPGGAGEVLRLPCLSVCQRHISGTTRPIFAKYLCMSGLLLPMSVARSSSGGIAMRYVGLLCV